MLKKKQYYISLLIGIVAFLLFFIVAYLIIALQMPKPQVGAMVTKNEQSTNTLVEVKEDVPRVEIYTKIILQTVDEGRKVVDKITIPATTLLGADEQNIKKRFEGYELLKFNEKEVVLQKEIRAHAEQATGYTLGIHNGFVCIVDRGSQNAVIDLQLLASDFSSKTYSMLLMQQISISEAQKEALLKKPDEIQKILQGYEQE